jgi:hypothetical protein
MLIGGKLKESDVETFLEYFRHQGAYNDDQNAISSDVKTVEDLQKFITEEGHIKIHDCEASGGELSEVQSTCIKLGMSYDHHNDSYYDCDATNEYVRDGKELGYNYSNGVGEDLVALHQLTNALGDDLELLDVASTEKVKSILKNLFRMDVNPLPKFEIVEG